MSSTVETAGPICENGHTMPSGASRCPDCGARLRMQWMTGDHVTVAQKRSPDGEILTWLLVGVMALVLGALISAGAVSADLKAVDDGRQLVMSSGAKAALIVGGLTSTVGVLAILVAVIAKGVQLGNRAA